MWGFQPRWAQRLEQKVDQLMSSTDSNFTDLSTAQAAETAALAKVKTDLEALIAKLAAVPPAGLTADQQAALNDAVAHAQTIAAGLSGLDAEANPPAPAPAPTPAPAPAPTPAPSTGS